MSQPQLAKSLAKAQNPVSIGVTLLFLLIVSALLFAPAIGAPNTVPVAQADATATPAADATTEPAATQTGTVRAVVVNVRSAPNLSAAILGKLNQGATVQIVARQGSWLQISYPSASAGKAWVFATLVTIGNTATASNSAASAMGAPVAKGFSNTGFTWTWGDAAKLNGQDWYFDIQMFRGGSKTPYKVLVVEPNAATLSNGVYASAIKSVADCDTFWVVQIAVRTGGKFSGWISPQSNRLAFGPACASTNQSAPAANPTEEPQPTQEPNPTEAA